METAAPKPELTDPAAIESFLETARLDLDHLRLDGSTVNRLRDAGLAVEGVRYFRGLYSLDPLNSLKSVYVGSVAHGYKELATTAYALLSTETETDALNGDLLHTIDHAMSLERVRGVSSRYERLANAAKALGKPANRRVRDWLVMAFSASAYREFYD